MKKSNLLFNLLLAAVLAISPNLKAGNWEIVGSGGFSNGVADYLSLAIDGSGTPYVAYRDGGNSEKASVMKFNDSSWVYLGNAGFSESNADGTSLAINESGIPYVAFSDFQYYMGKSSVMNFNGSNWVYVGSSGFSEGNSNFISLAIDGNGIPYVAYEDYDIANNFDRASVMKFNGSNWVNVGEVGFASGGITYTSLAINDSGTPYVAYRDGGHSHRATVMKFNGITWEYVGNPGFSAGCVKYTSLALNNSGTPYVAYKDSVNFDKATVKMYADSTWATVGNAGFSVGAATDIVLKIDRNNVPYVVYTDWGNSCRVSLMKFNGTTWEYVGMAGFSSDNATYTSLAINANGKPYVAYKDWARYDKVTVGKYVNEILPYVNTLSPTSIDSKSVTLNGNLGVVGYPSPTQHGFCWDTNGIPTVHDSKKEMGAIDSIGNYSTVIDNLSQNTSYYVRAFATNTLGTDYGETVPFRTLGIPVVSTLSVESIDIESATVTANISDFGNPNLSRYGFCWNTGGIPTIEDSIVVTGIIDSTGNYSDEIYNLLENTRYYVRAFALNTLGTAYGDTLSFRTLETSLSKNIPEEFDLAQNYPNPFNPRTVINYQLSADSKVELSIFDMNGKTILTLINEFQSAGHHTLNWDASNLSSGIYFYRLQAGDFIDTKKMVFMK